MVFMKHIICFSGGHSSALVAIEATRKYGKENIILLNHDINSKKEDCDIKRFKNQIAEYLQIPITYANINGITNPDNIPNQFEVCIKSSAFTTPNGDALCTSRLKTEPFYQWLGYNFPHHPTLFNPQTSHDCKIYYGFDKKELTRINRRIGIMGAMGYVTDYPLAFWKDRTIFSTLEVDVVPPLTYDVYEHANCKGCLKASLLHWYVTYVHEPEIYAEGVFAESEIAFTIHTVKRNKIKIPISLTELALIFERMRVAGVPATEHQSKHAFAYLLREYQLEECSTGLSCECLA